MKTTTAALALAALLVWGTACRADITSDTHFADDGDGVLSCYTYGFTQVGEHEFQLNIDGVHHSPNGFLEAGHILGDIIADSELDPKLTLPHEIDNDTTFDWTDYHAVVTMNKEFTFDLVTVGVAGWSINVVQPVLVGSDWVGTIDYNADHAGSAIVAIGDTLDFGYRMTFLGGASFSEALTPTPEPGTLAMLGCCGLGLLFVRRRFAR